MREVVYTLMALVWKYRKNLVNTFKTSFGWDNIGTCELRFSAYFAHRWIISDGRVGSVLCGWSEGVTGDKPCVDSTLCSEGHLQKWEEWKARWARVVILGRWPRFSFQPPWYWISEGSKRRREMSFPEMCVCLLVFLAFQNAYVLLKDGVVPLLWCLGKPESFGEETGKQREGIFLKSWAVGRCRTHEHWLH